jgi:phosphatidylserine/phosphatidylglycerophosphate/cardiolipin synthase-like enzyme
VTGDAAHIPYARSGAYPLRPGNLVRPLVDGEPAFRRIGEAVEAARARVWVTVAFVDRDVCLPGGQGTFFDVLERAAARGLDVRVLFWREPELATILPGTDHFAGTEAEWGWLRERGARFLARWDHLPRYCHHQKSWVVDAGTAGEVAFVGGINLDRGSMVAPGHLPLRDGDNIHDVYVEVRGPAATDVQHNFVQRWNEASERATPRGTWPDAETASDLRFPASLSTAAGEVPVQITRTVRAERYTAATATPGAPVFAIAAGEASVAEQYLAAVDAAASSIYFENQFFGSHEILARLERALERGIEVVYLLPAVPMVEIRTARSDARYAVFFERLAGLGRYDNFTMAGLAACAAPARYQDVYVHAKAALIDDGWATIGSTNLMTRSFYGDTELNASFWHGATVRALRRELLREHLAMDTEDIDDRAALRLYREIAHANRDRRRRGEALRGLAVALDPAEYGA